MVELMVERRVVWTVLTMVVLKVVLMVDW